MMDTTPLLRLYAGRRLAQLEAQDAAAVQARLLRRLLRRAQSTEFGRAHGFASIDSVAAYQRQVPLRRYETFWEEWWQPAFPCLAGVTWPARIPYFALSSGTTSGVTKYIPVSRAMIRANRRAALDVLVWHVANRHDSRVLGGKSFVLGGSTALAKLGRGVRAGDLSGIAAAEVPWWARRRYFPAPDLALIEDWECKVATLAPLSLEQDIRSLSGTPSWLLLFLDHVAALRPDLPRRLDVLYPGLELIVHGGVSFAPYRSRFAGWFAGTRICTREVYPASEGFVAIQDRGSDEGLRMLLDNGLFYEFVDPAEIDNPHARYWVGDVQAGREYALVLTSNAGLWSYVLGDTVTLCTTSPPRLLVTGRTAYMLSVTGEHVIGREIDAAIEAAARAAAVTVVEYAAAPLLPESGARAGHIFIVELAARPEAVDIPRFAGTLDQTLARLNADYRAHRQGEYGMLAPTVRLVRPGTFAAWMRHRGRLGGQNKVPRVINDPALLDDLIGFSAR